LISAFDTTYLAFERELEGSCKEKGNGTIECQKIVYELLCMGQQLLAVIHADEKWKYALMYKQFAINLAIHSLHFDDTQKASSGEGLKEHLQKIAKSWMQIDMLGHHAQS
jgi:hypothetical protein